MTSILVGRDAELSPVQNLLSTGDGGSLRCLVIEGDPGIGKTALWEAATALARDRGFRVLSARCRGSETQLAFAALGDLLAESHDLLSTLPSPQRRGLAGALLLEEHGEPEEPRAVALGFLNSIRTLAASGPALLAIDDLQWLDPASATALDFALARLVGEPIAVLATARRTGTPGRLSIEDVVAPERLTRVALGPLSLGGIYELLRTRLNLELSRPVLTRLHEASGGNPLFALEIGRLLVARGDTPTAGEDFPVPRSVERAVEERLAALPDETREAMLVVALTAQPTIELVDAVCPEARSKLAPAVDSHVLELEPERIRFAHPLFAAAIRATADAAQRRALHAKLASLVSKKEEQARHLARAATGADAAAADALESAARDALRRAAPEEAAELFEEAIRLNPEPEERRRLGLAAAAAYNDALDADRAASILGPVLADAPEGRLRARALLELFRARPGVSSEAIAAEALHNAGDDPHLRAEILNHLATALEVERGIAAASATAREALREAERTSDERLIAVTLAFAGHLATLGEPGGAGIELLERARELPARGISGWSSPEHWIAVRLMWEDRLDEARELLEKQLRLAEDELDVWSQGGLCFHLSQLETRAGEPERALAFAERGWEVETASRRQQNRAITMYARALAHANFGDEQLARAVAADALAILGEGGDLFFTIHTRSALAQLELSLNRPTDAVVALANALELREATGVGEPGIFPFDADEIEALVAVGRVGEAEALARDLLDRGRKLGRARLIATGLRSRALVVAAAGGLDEAMLILREALTEHERLPVPLERGRTLLVFGSVLRRAQHKREARQTLERAASLFAAIGTTRWERCARAEAERIGGRAAPHGLLTAMEERIADLAASGRTNAEIATALHVSPRTVQWNLSKIYKKLAVRSRTELAASRLQPRA